MFDNILYFIYYRVIECSELTIKNSSCDPFATVTVIYSNGKQISKRTKVRKKTSSPYFNETFIFEVRKYITHYYFERKRKGEKDNMHKIGFFLYYSQN